ncbi:TPA: hypothetical protein ACNIJL_004705 [Pseudomonas aeruginosa]
MNTRNTDVDRDLRTLISAADRIMAVAEDDRKKAARLMAQLKEMQTRIEQRLSSIPTVVAKSLDESAETTAKKAAHLLAGNFRQANEEASKATTAYRQAASDIKPWLTRLLILQGMVLFAQVAVLVIATY